MLTIVLLGVVLMSATVALHVAGTVVWLHTVFGKQSSRQVLTASTDRVREFSVHYLLRSFFATTAVVLALHIVEVLLWAVAYYCWIPAEVSPGDFSECVYFSMVTYTTLGYGDIVIEDGNWRLLCGIQAMGGMLAFGWSSALLFAAVQHVAQLNLKKD